ncbi:Eco57I restriction-modification methylase domain-containing protein [Pontibacter indicus]|nr:N-6 DNA methylase [Pontibacter indicus]
MAQLYNPIFSQTYLDSKTANFHLSQYPDLSKKLDEIDKWQKGIRSGRIVRQKEEELKAEFLNTFFGEVLDYPYKSDETLWNLSIEKKSNIDGTKADGALGYFWLFGNEIKADVRTVIELKDARTDLDKPQNRLNDKRSPVEQAFSYVSKSGGHCNWVIVSNFTEIRLYHSSDQSRYEKFEILRLLEEKELLRFMFLLHKDRLLTKSGDSITNLLYKERQAEEQNISDKFYKHYKKARVDLYHHLQEQNPDVDGLVILQKTQKLLDRVTFVCFCEDLNIIPKYTFRSLLKAVKEDKFNRNDTKIYESVKGLFKAIDEGYPEENINKFNGGLFAQDSVLDSLQVKDSTLEYVINLETYNFSSDLNVNILGHIFEQSVSDIEELKAEIKGESFDESQGKRKTDGIFYTPDYITHFIVRESIGGWLQEQQYEIGFSNLPELNEVDYQSIKFDKKQKLVTNKNIEKHIIAWEAYREKLINIKVLDPACGSGAFLNQVYDYLFQEGQRVNKELARLRAGQFEAFDLDKHILTENIFGVDLNEESVEITKLSLWLKTANKGKELTTLDANIKCGNSIIEDSTVAVSKAFNWQESFPDVFNGGGFDVIVGNPPYGAKLNVSERSYIQNRYNWVSKNIEIYSVFLEKAIELLKPKGIFGYIIPVSWQSNEAFQKSRDLIEAEGELLIGIKLPYDAFEDAYVDTGIYVIKKGSNKVYTSSVYEFNERAKINNLSLANIEYKKLKNSYWQSLASKKLVFNPSYYELINKINQNKRTLSEISNSIRGVLPAPTDVSQSYVQGYKKYLSGNVYRYMLDRNFSWIKYGDNLREKPSDYSYFTGERILIRRLINRQFRLMATYAEDEFVNKKDIYNIKLTTEDEDIYYILGWLNSALISFILTKGSTTASKDDFSQLTLTDVRTLRIVEGKHKTKKDIADNTKVALEKNNELSILSNNFLNLLNSELAIKISNKLFKWYGIDNKEFISELTRLNKKLTLSQKSQWLSYFDSQQKEAQELLSTIGIVESKIDEQVYKLYNLTDSERSIIENALFPINEEKLLPEVSVK